MHVSTRMMCIHAYFTLHIMSIGAVISASQLPLTNSRPSVFNVAVTYRVDRWVLWIYTIV